MAQVVDERLHDDSCDFLRQVCLVGATIVVVGTALPPVLLLVPPLGFLFAKVQNRYGSSARELQRLESVSRSPIYSQFSVRTINTLLRALRALSLR